MKYIGLIPRKRLKLLPHEVRCLHELCFFLHDEMVRCLKEYEDDSAHWVKVAFRDEADAKLFNEVSKIDGAISALEKMGYEEETLQVLVNTIIMAMVSDCLHHIYEALQCFEKRKFVVGFNLLRKPLKDNFLYLSWILGDKEGFYSEFMKGDPKKLSQSLLGNRREELFDKAGAKTELGTFLSGKVVEDILFNKRNENGLEQLFQHAVHLVTVQNVELRTSSQNFNFIFKDPRSEDVYFVLYENLPYVLLFLSHVIFELCNEMKKVDQGARRAFFTRTVESFLLLTEGGDGTSLDQCEHVFLAFACADCRTPLKMTKYNYARILMTESFRCTSCRRMQAFPFSWMF